MARIFLSYSSDHNELAERIAVALRGDGHVVFFDRHALPASADYHGRIRREIRRSDLLVFLISARSIRSGSYAITELRIAQREWKSPRFRVVPLLAERVPIDGLPAFLREVTIVEPEGNAVGELTHAVDVVLRRNRRRFRFRLGAAAGAVAFSLAAWFGFYELAQRRGWVGQTSSEDEPTSSASSVPSSSVAERTDEQVPRSELDLSGGAHIGLRLVPEGRFVMGAPRTEQTDRIAEPQRELVMPRFWIGETEVTQAQWLAVMGSNPSDCSRGCLGDHPVNRVDHHDAILFTNRLSELQGLEPCYHRVGGTWWRDDACEGYRLPSEAEWEYAARAGTQTRFSYGDDPRESCRHANGRDLTRVRETQSGRGHLSCEDGFVDLAPVASFEPNPWGLHDVHGNAWEWVWDASPDDERRRIIRGGSFLDKAEGLRVANRNHHLATEGRYSVGFRIARSATEGAFGLALTR